MNPSTSQLKKDDILMQIRDKLRKDNIKLWLPPYYNESTGSSHEKLKVLSQSYSELVKAPVDACYETILELQTNSLENLKQSHRYRQSGLATLKIKILYPSSPAKIITKELLLSLRVSDFKDLIAKEVNITRDKIKLIYGGKVLVDEDSLGSQGVKNGQQLLAITLSTGPDEVRRAEKQIRELEGIKTDSRLLASDEKYMQLEDQFGNVIRIPKEEKQALMIAMALHEKGRAELKREDFSRALVFFLEADQEFRHCNSSLLNSVDNYALLDLDIAWCYLCLQSVAQLPEAYERLKRCEERFFKSYGQNLERVMAVKGATGNEAALLLRLHLLQGIVLYHKNRRAEALELFKKAQQEMIVLKVDEDKILMLVELGYSTAEARLGLRANGGDVNLAANYIRECRDKRLQSRKRAMAEEILEKKKRKLGKCIDGKQYVNPNFVNILVNMGYNSEAARVALQNTNNIITESIQYIQENPQPGPSQSKSIEFLSLINDLVPELEAAGFDPTMAKLALHKHGGDIMKAAEELITNNGVIEDADYSVLKPPAPAKSTSEGKSKVDDKKKQEQEMKNAAYKRLAEDILMVDDDHLDLSLAQEEIFLHQYLSLLENQ